MVKTRSESIASVDGLYPVSHDSLLRRLHLTDILGDESRNTFAVDAGVLAGVDLKRKHTNKTIDSKCLKFIFRSTESTV
jgi:hypothetical protein